MSHFTRKVRSVLLLAAMASLACAPGACQKAPPPPPPAPIPPPPPAPPGHVPAALLNGVVDDAVEYIAGALNDVEAVRSSSRKQVLALGPLKIEGNGAAEPGFASAVQSLHARLQENPELRENFAFVKTSQEDARDLLARESDPAGFGDPIDPTKLEAGKPARYAPNSIYVLTGVYSQVGESRDGEVRYRLSVEVNHPASRKLIVSRGFQSDLSWNEDAAEWVVEGN